MTRSLRGRQETSDSIDGEVMSQVYITAFRRLQHPSNRMIKSRFGLRILVKWSVHAALDLCLELDSFGESASVILIILHSEHLWHRPLTPKGPSGTRRHKLSYT
jgi:hypothetical protein